MKNGTRQKIENLTSRLVDAQRDYRENKDKIVEGSITYAESKSSKWLAPLFICLFALDWLIAIFIKMPLGEIFDAFDFAPVTITFFISYFGFFHVSRLISRPSAEEIADDTSYIALFSACEARERRGLSSAAFGVINTGIWTIFVITKQTGFDSWRLF